MKRTKMDAECYDREFCCIRNEVNLLELRFNRFRFLVGSYKAADDETDRNDLNLDLITYFEMMTIQLRALGLGLKDAGRGKTEFCLAKLLEKAKGSRTSLWDDFLNDIRKIAPDSEKRVGQMVRYFDNKYICHLTQEGYRENESREEEANKIIHDEIFDRFVSFVIEYFGRYCDEKKLYKRPNAEEA